MKVLVTGATGFVGRHVVDALLARGHAVVVAVRDEAKLGHCGWRDAVTRMSFDLGADAGGVFDEAGKPDAVLHAAWDRLGDYRDPVHYEAMAVQHYRFLRGLVDAGLTQCLVLGTCLEYGMQEGPLHEELPAEPVLPYPLGKHLLRLMLRGLQQRQPFTLQWVRLFYLYGPGQRRNSLLAQLDAALAEGRPAFDMSPGDQVRDYLPVQAVAANLAALIECRGFNGIVNCCSGEPLSVRELVERHLRERGATIALNPGKYPYPDYEPHAFWGDRSRLDTLLKP